MPFICDVFLRPGVPPTQLARHFNFPPWSNHFSQNRFRKGVLPNSNEWVWHSKNSGYYSFAFLFMPFGLTNVGQTFPNLMDSLFHFFPFIFIYLDDILVFSHSRSDHLSHLKTVLASLAANGPRLNSLSFGHLHWHSTSQFACPANSCFPCTHWC